MSAAAPPPSSPEGTSVPTIRARFESQGYLRLPNVFSPGEVEELRERVRIADEKVAATGRKSDLMSHPELRAIMLDDRILSVAKQLLGNDCVYFGWSTYFRNDPGRPHMHNDAKGAPGNPRIPNDQDPASTDWPILRFGIYLQDHSSHSGGLKVRDHSHRHYLLNRQNLRKVLNPFADHGLDGFPTGRLINIPSRPGDLLVFNMRTHHSGHFVRLRAMPNVVFHPGMERLLLKSLPTSSFVPEERERNVLFTTFGRPSAQLDGFIANRALRRGNADHWRHTRFHLPENVRALEARGIQVDTRALEIAAAHTP